jgi:hypothetical protein
MRWAFHLGVADHVIETSLSRQLMPDHRLKRQIMRRRILRPWESMAVHDPVKRFRVRMEKETTRRAGHQLARHNIGVVSKATASAETINLSPTSVTRPLPRRSSPSWTWLDADVANAATGLAESDLSRKLTDSPPPKIASHHASGTWHPSRYQNGGQARRCQGRQGVA